MRARALAVSICLVPVVALAAAWAAPAPRQVVFEDPGECAVRSGAPVCAAVDLAAWRLRPSDRLALRELQGGKAVGQPVPAQFEALPGSATRGRVWCLLPAGAGGKRAFALQRAAGPGAAYLRARKDEPSGQFDIAAGDLRVLRYNYATIEPGELLKSISKANLIYARPRSNYIHPLFGPEGEELTRDWSVDHPHHRGIYWAWPEVQYAGEMGDLHALQRVFARPTGTVSLVEGPVYAQIEAENRWLWEDKQPIVLERALIRAYAATPSGRCVDLTFTFRALVEGVTLARRGTSHYGGLNLRFSAVREQKILWHTDPPEARPRMAWEVIHGTFSTGKAPLGVALFQHPANPEYPGDWVKYPELNWSQPTFPTAKTRYPLSRETPLVLRFRLWIRPGAVAADAVYADMWRAYQGLERQ